MADATELTGPVHLPLSTRAGTAPFRLWYGDFEEHGRWVMAVTGDVHGGDPIPLRIESACVFGHVFGSAQCDCGYQLDTALERMVTEGRGVVVYGLDQDARGLGVATHFQIYVLRQQEELDTEDVYKRLQAPWDARDYSAVPKLLRAAGVQQLRLLSNNPERLNLLVEAGFDVEPEPLEAPLDRYNMGTLMLEQEDLGYTTRFRTHTDWLGPLQAAVAGDAELTSAQVVADGEEVARCEDRRWNIARRTVERFGQAPPGATTVAYLTDLPRRDDVAVWVEAGVDVLVVPFPRLPASLHEQCARAGIRLQDWSRANAYAAERPQWEFVRSEEGVDTYVRGDRVRLVLTREETGKSVFSTLMRNYAGQGTPAAALDEETGPAAWAEFAR